MREREISVECHNRVGRPAGLADCGLRHRPCSTHGAALDSQVYCSIRKFLAALELPAPLLEGRAGAIVSCANCNGGTSCRAPSKQDYGSAALPVSLGDSSLDAPSVFTPSTVCPPLGASPPAFPLPTSSSSHCHSSSSDSSVTVAGSPPFRSMVCSSSPVAAHAGRDKVAGNFFTQKVTNVKQRWNTLLKEW